MSVPRDAPHSGSRPLAGDQHFVQRVAGGGSGRSPHPLQRWRRVARGLRPRNPANDDARKHETYSRTARPPTVKIDLASEPRVPGNAANE